MSLFSRSRMDLTEGPIFPSLLRFSVPILAGSIVTQLYNVVDSMVVGQFVGADALAAVSASAPVMTIINMFLIGLSSGSNVIIAQRVGAGKKEALQRAVGTVALLTFVFAALITVLGLVLSKPLLTLMGTPENIYDDSYSYLVIVFIGAFGNLVYNMGSGALRGMGDSSWPFLFLLLCSGLNVVFDLAAVLIFNMGVVGVAIATALSQLISAVGILCRMNRGPYGVRISFRHMYFDKGEAARIAGIGLPAGIQNIGNAVASLAVQTSANTFGSAFVAANSIVNKVDDFAYIPIVALSTGLCTFVGQNMGGFLMERIRKGINQSILSLVLLGSAICGILIIFRNVLPYAFTVDPEVVRIASEGIFIMAFASTFHGIDRCLVNAMRGAGKSVVPMVTAQFGALSRIPLAYFLAVCTGQYKGIFYAMLIASLLRTIAIAVYYFCGGWKRAVKKFEEKHRRASETA